MGAMSPTHWLIVIGVLVLLFGAKKLPDLARSVGQSTRLFKGEMRGLKQDDEAAAPQTDDAAKTAPPAVPPAAQPAVQSTTQSTTQPSTQQEGTARTDVA